MFKCTSRASEKCAFLKTVIFQQIVCEPARFESCWLSFEVECIIRDFMCTFCRMFSCLMTTAFWPDPQPVLENVRSFSECFRHTLDFAAEKSGKRRTVMPRAESPRTETVAARDGINQKSVCPSNEVRSLPTVSSVIFPPLPNAFPCIHCKIRLHDILMEDCGIRVCG